MSALAALYNVPGTRDEFALWAFAHMAHHRDINRRIFELGGVQIQDYPLDPFNPMDEEDAEDWSYAHQFMHNQMDAVLGISGYNLLSPNFRDPTERASWIYLNSDEHRQASDLLGIG